MNDEEEEITIPFVLTDAHGGEYPTEAFAAGWLLGVLDARLTLANTAGLLAPSVILRSKWRKQIDLIAMSHSLMVQETVSEEDPGYSYFTIAPAEFFNLGRDTTDDV